LENPAQPIREAGEFFNFARHLMSELSLVGNWQGEKKKE